MLETPVVSDATFYAIIKHMSENVFSDPDNQQERFLSEIPNKLGWFIVGFTEGEGSFNLSVMQRKDYVLGWQLNLSFNISQKEGVLLDLIKETLKCGSIRSRKDGVYAFDVRGISDITEKIVSFFNHFHLFSNEKRKTFEIFSEIAEMMKNKEHLKVEGLEKILQLRSLMNPNRGRKRKYTNEYVLGSIKKILRDYTPSPIS